MWRSAAALVVVLACGMVAGNRVVEDTSGNEPESYFEPYHPGFVGSWTDPTNDRRWRVNPGDGRSNMHPNIFEGVHPRQLCPNMTAADPAGHHYCTHEQAGYCDRRSGTCLCFEGYQGLDCSGCRPTHFLNDTLCLPKVNCPSDCSGAGTCDYSNGTCTCEPYRLGDDCSIPFCEQYDRWCVECDVNSCNRCVEGYYVDPLTNACVPCTDYDPRCTVCDHNSCLECGDPLLKSIRRSGRRRQDQRLPFDELRRETSDTNPHMTQLRTAYDEAERFYLVSDTVGLKGAGFQRSTADSTEDVYIYDGGVIPPPADGDPLAYELRNTSVECAQGLQRDAAWHCAAYPVSHRVCGHPGVFSFSAPTYEVHEYMVEVRITVVRSGGGLGRASVKYNLIHNTSTPADVTPTQHYTSTQTLVFEHGQVRKSFLVAINDDNIPEAIEFFRLELSEPSHGASLGNQWITRVSILDDELAPQFIINYLNTTATVLDDGSAIDTVVFEAGSESVFEVVTLDFVGNRVPENIRDDAVIIEIWDQASVWNTELGYQGGVGVHDYIDAQDGVLAQFDGTAAGQPRTSVISGVATDGALQDGIWQATVVPIKRGTYDLHVKHATREGLLGSYFDNPYLLGDPVFERKDHVVNHTWGGGRITQFGTDFVAVRWTGYVLTEYSGDYTFHVDADDNVRLWVDNELLIDKWWSPTGDSFGSILLIAQRLYSIRLEYRDQDGDAHCWLSWTTPIDARHVIPSYLLYTPNHIPGSPFEYTVKAGAAHANDTGPPGGSVAFGQGLVDGVAGVTSTFSIFSRDIYGNDRLEDGASDVFRILAVREADSSPGFGGASGGIGLEEVAGVLTFNPETYLHAVTWRPTQSGVYKIHVDLWVDWRLFDPIYGSPFTAVIEPAPTNAAESDVFGIGIEEGVAGTLFNFTIVARDSLGNLRGVTGDDWKILAAHVNESLGVEASCVDPFENGTYSCSYRPLVKGNYLLYVTLDGLQVRNSPYSVFVDYAATNGARCVAEGPGLLNATEGVEAYFDVFIRDAFDNPRILPADDGDVFDVNLRVSTPAVVGARTFVADDVYRVMYTPTTSGVLNLEVIVEGLEITGSPFHPLVVPGAAFEGTTTATGVGLTNGTAGKLPQFTVQVRDTSGNEKITGLDSVVVRSTATQETPGGPVLVVTEHDCEYTGGTTGVYLCVYNATVAATHVLDVELNGAAIFGSPFAPLIVPAEMDPFTSVASGSGLEYVVAGDFAPVFIRPVDFWGNDLLRALDTTVEIVVASFKGVGPSGQGTFEETGMGDPEPERELAITDLGNGTLDIGYTPLISGAHLLTFDQTLGEGLDGTYFATQDFLSAVTTRVDATIDFDFGDRRPDALPQQGELYSVRWEGFFRAAVSEVHRFRIVSTGNVRFRMGMPRASLVQSESGTGTEEVDPVDGELFLDGEVTLIEAMPAVVTTHTGDIRLTADLWYPIIVEFADVDGRNGTISWLFSTPSTPEGVVPTSQLYRGTTYPVSLSPYEPLIVPAPASPINSLAEGAGLTNAVSNITASFVVHVRDRFNNSRGFWGGGDNVTVIAERVGVDALLDADREEATFTGTVVDLLNGFYQVTYVPQVSGVYHLNVFVNQNFTEEDFGPTAATDFVAGGHIEASPFVLVVGDDGGYGPTSTSFGHGRNFAEAGVEDTFQVQARDVNSNNRTATDAVLVQLDLRDGQGQDLRGVHVFGTAVYAGDGLYNVFYTATHAYYYDLTVLINGLHAFDSPYELFLTPAPADGPTSDTEFAINSTAVASQDTYFTVFARDEFGNLRLAGGEEFVVRLIGPTTQQNTVIVTQGVVFDNDNGTYTVRYNVPLAGFYNIHVDMASDRNTPQGLLGEFFTNQFLFGDPVWSQVDPYVDQVFDTPGVPQLTRYASVYHSARWSGFIQAPANGTYTFTTASDDGSRLFVDDELVIDFIDGPAGTHSGTMPHRFLGDALYAITLEYTQLTGTAAIQLLWSYTDGLAVNVTEHVVPSERLFSGAAPISGSPFRMTAS